MRLDLRDVLNELDRGLFAYTPQISIEGNPELKLASKWILERIAERLDTSDIAELTELALGAMAVVLWDEVTGGAEEILLLRDRLVDVLSGSYGWTFTHYVCAVQAVEFLVKVDRPSAEGILDSIDISSLATRAGTNSETPDVLSIRIARLRELLKSSTPETNPSRLSPAAKSKDEFVASTVIWSAAHVAEHLAVEAFPDIERLKRWLRDRVPNEANFIAYCSVLRLIADTDEISLAVETRGTFEGEERLTDPRGAGPFVSTGLHELLRHGRREDGSWFGSMIHTAWLLIAARSVCSIREVRVPMYKYARIMADARMRLGEIEMAALAESRRVKTQIVPRLIFNISVGTSVLVAISILAYIDVQSGTSIALGAFGAIGIASTFTFSRNIRSNWKQLQALQ